MEKKGGDGRKKIPMEKIENESHREVTFTKRREGLFNKLNEICIRCDAEVASITFSPGNKAYSFGHPSVAKTINDYLISTNVDNNPVVLLADPTPNLPDPNINITEMAENLSKEKAKGKQLDELKKATENHDWWDGAAEDDNYELTQEQIELLKLKLEKAYNDMSIERQKIGFESQFYGMGTQDPVPFDQIAPGASANIDIPYYESALGNEFHHDIPILFPNNVSSAGESHQDLGTGIPGINPTIPFDPSLNAGVGPSGNNTYYGPR